MCRRGLKVITGKSKLIALNGECAGSCSVGRPRKRWVDTLKDCLIKERFGYQASKENGTGVNDWGF